MSNRAAVLFEASVVEPTLLAGPLEVVRPNEADRWLAAVEERSLEKQIGVLCKKKMCWSF